MTYLPFLDEPEARKFLDELLNRAIDRLKEKNENELANVLQKMSKNYSEKFKEALDGRNGEFLTHGDLWSNNVMFNGSEVIQGVPSQNLRK